MPDRLIVVPGGLLRSARVPPQMVDDLCAVAEIPDQVIETIAAQLGAQEGVLTSSRLEGLLMAALGDERHVAAAAATLRNLSPEKIPQTLRSLGEWRDADQENAGRLGDETFRSLERKLPQLIQQYRALATYRKAGWLASVIGNSATSLEMICDARPVYNEQRDSIEGMIPLTILKIVYEGQDEETRSVEVYLTTAMVDELVEKAQKAQQKQKILKESIEAWVPNGLVVFPE